MQNEFVTRYETTIDTPIEKVWDALINPTALKQYLFGTELLTDWQVGKPIVFRGSWENTPYEDKGIVLSFAPLQSLSYSYLSSWSGMPDLPENYLWVGYEVASQDTSTTLVITQSNYDAEKAQHSESSWTAVIDGLKKYLQEQA